MNHNIIFIPYYGKKYNFLKCIIENITKCEVIMPSNNYAEVLKLGMLYSPKEICLPFKYDLGNYLISLRKGANILIHTGGLCLYGYFGELQEQILKELGYKFTFYNLSNNNQFSIKKIYKFAKEINPRLNIMKYLYHILNGILYIICIDKLTNYYLENYARSTNKTQFDTFTSQKEILFLKTRINPYKIFKIYSNILKQYKSIPLNNMVDPIKILLVGDYISLINEYINNDIISKLLRKNVIIYQETNLTRLIQNIFNPKMNYGTSSQASIVIKYCNKGIDGVIHLKNHRCIRELNTIPIINKITKDYNIPILYLDVNNDSSIVNNDEKITNFYQKTLNKRDKINHINSN